MAVEASLLAMFGVSLSLSLCLSLSLSLPLPVSPSLSLPPSVDLSLHVRYHRRTFVTQSIPLRLFPQIQIPASQTQLD